MELKGYGESALFLGILGDPKDGKIPLEYLKVLFGEKTKIRMCGHDVWLTWYIEQERLPYKEGWRPLEQPLTQTQMNHLIFSLTTANEHKAAEAAEVGLGTVHAVTSAVTSILPSYCNVM